MWADLRQATHTLRASHLTRGYNKVTMDKTKWKTHPLERYQYWTILWLSCQDCGRNTKNGNGFLPGKGVNVLTVNYSITSLIWEIETVQHCRWREQGSLFSLPMHKGVFGSNLCRTEGLKKSGLPHTSKLGQREQCNKPPHFIHSSKGKAAQTPAMWEGSPGQLASLAAGT